MNGTNNTSTSTLIVLSTHKKLWGVIVGRQPLSGDWGALERTKHRRKNTPGLPFHISFLFFLRKERKWGVTLRIIQKHT